MADRPRTSMIGHLLPSRSAAMPPSPKWFVACSRARARGAPSIARSDGKRTQKVIDRIEEHRGEDPRQLRPLYNEGRDVCNQKMKKDEADVGVAVTRRNGRSLAIPHRAGTTAKGAASAPEPLQLLAVGDAEGEPPAEGVVGDAGELTQG